MTLHDLTLTGEDFILEFEDTIKGHILQSVADAFDGVEASLDDWMIFAAYYRAFNQAPGDTQAIHDALLVSYEDHDQEAAEHFLLSYHPDVLPDWVRLNIDASVDALCKIEGLVISYFAGTTYIFRPSSTEEHRPVLLVDGRHGVYAWRVLAKTRTIHLPEGSEWAIEALMSGPDDEHYWAAAEHVEDYGAVPFQGGVMRTLYQYQGDIYALHPEMAEEDFYARFGM